MSIIDYVPVIGSSILVVGGALAYWNQKGIDREHQLIVDKREVYRSYLKWSAQVMANMAHRPNLDNTEAQEMMMASRFDTLILGSEGVITAMSKHASAVNNTANEIIESQNSGQASAFTGKNRISLDNTYADLVYEMRQDSFKASKLSREDLKTYLPFYSGEQS